MEAEDMDAAYWEERRWGHAIGTWLDGDRSALADLLRNESLLVPLTAREFLADLAAGTLKKGKGGRPAERDGWVERAIVAELFEEWDAAEAVSTSSRMSPKDEAMSIVAERRKITADAVRALADKFKSYGITRDAWRAWGRPKWTNR